MSDILEVIMKKCKNANRYKAIYPPKCDPCDFCAKKWKDAQNEKKKFKKPDNWSFEKFART
jgi:hypothetical protein